MNSLFQAQISENRAVAVQLPTALSAFRVPSPQSGEGPPWHQSLLQLPQYNDQGAAKYDLSHRQRLPQSPNCTSPTTEY